MLDLNRVYNTDCIEGLRKIDDETVDLTVTSPPYDNLRSYDKTLEWDFDVFKDIADKIFKVTKPGGIVVWVVGDATIDGNETGTSFKQALYFKDIGFKLYDTMIYKKKNFLPQSVRRYEQEFEYMFCFLKGISPNTFNPIKVPCIYAGQSNWGDSTTYRTPDKKTSIGKHTIGDFKRHGNVFEYTTGSLVNSGKDHPAPFPYKLAYDQIVTWTNEDDLVLDPFMGSGTTCEACIELNRNFIGIEKVEKYYNDTFCRLEKEFELNKFRKADLFTEV